MNKVMKLLMLSDIFIVTGSGLIEPILALFINGNITGATVFGIGLASTIFLIVRSMVSLPFSKYVDKHDGKIKWLLIGTFLSVLVPIIYLMAKDMWAIYFAQVVQGIGSGLAYPCWLGLWSANINKKKRSFEWSLYTTLTGVGTAISAAVGSAIANYLGFYYTFILMGIMSLAGGITLFGLESRESEKHTKLKQFISSKKANA